MPIVFSFSIAYLLAGLLGIVFLPGAAAGSFAILILVGFVLVITGFVLQDLTKTHPDNQVIQLLYK